MKRWSLLVLGLAACTQPKPDADPPEPVTLEPPLPDASAPPGDPASPLDPPPPEPEPVAPATPEEGRSCAFAPRCGAAAAEEKVSCCETDWVPGGVLQMGFSSRELTDVAAIDISLADRDQPIGVSGFFLDRFEITVGRFLTYARQYDGTPLPVGAGAHPRIEGSGWQEDWNSELYSDLDELLALTSCGVDSDPRALLDQLVPVDESDAGSSLARRLFRIDLETLAALDRPMACLSWFQAQAFCIWDGGRLPTEAEWELAAAGGAENRAYPWGDDVSFLDALTEPGPVGARPWARGRYGQDDLAGGLREWTFDGFSEQYRAPGGAGHECSDCANLLDANGRTVRGGNDASCCTGFAAGYRSAARVGAAPGLPTRVIGARCARDATDLPSAADQTAASPRAPRGAFSRAWLPADWLLAPTRVQRADP